MNVAEDGVNMAKQMLAAIKLRSQPRCALFPLGSGGCGIGQWSQ